MYLVEVDYDGADVYFYGPFAYVTDAEAFIRRHKENRRKRHSCFSYTIQSMQDPFSWTVMNGLLAEY